MGYTESFMDNATYGASDINGIIKKLSTQGISVEFEDILNDGVSYTPSDLNQLFAAIASEGVTKDSCRVLLSDGNAKVSSGTIIFAGGSTITVDSAGVVLTVTPGVKNYVYAISQPSLNHNYLKCETTAPTGDYVMLAEVENGVVTDKRKFAASKFVAGYNMHEIFTISKSYTAPIADDIVNPTNWRLVDTIAVKKSDYKKCLFKNTDAAYASEDRVPIDAIWDLDTGTCGYGGIMGLQDRPYLTERIRVYNYTTTTKSSGFFIKFVRNGLNIDVYACAAGTGTSDDVSRIVNYTIELC